MNCQNCGTANADQSRFCIKCGGPLATQQATTPPEQAHRPTPGSPVRGMRSLTTAPGERQTSPTPQPKPDGDESSFQSPPPIQQSNFPPPAQSTPPSQPAVPRPHSPSVVKQSSQQLSTNLSAGLQQGFSNMNIWGPFAGFGSRRRHVGWLMDGQGARYQDLVRRIGERFNDRRIPDVQITQEKLTAKGVLVETRPYFILKRGLVSLALNVSAFGQDLFISLATYLKPPISNFRVILLGAAILFALLGGPVMIGSVRDNLSFGGFSGSSNNSLLTILCVIGPLWTLNWLGLQIGLLFSFYKWLTEKDFLALLRVKPNEFNEDDLMSMEKAVEQTVRSALDDIGLNPADLKPAAVQGHEQRLI